MAHYFEFEVSLKDVRPKIWRRFLIHEGATFMDLHDAIQDACGWLNCHLFSFQAPGGVPLAGVPDNEYGESEPDAEKVKIASFFGLGGGKQCFYNYDFGDDWCHEVRNVKILELPEEFERRLLAGARAFPKEDCGSISGYQDCVRVALGGKDKDGIRAWMEGWHPERFDLETTRQQFDRGPVTKARNHRKKRAAKRGPQGLV
jgi:hypothetical protein